LGVRSRRVLFTHARHQAFGLLIDERAGTGGAGAVSGKGINTPGTVCMRELQKQSGLAADAHDSPRPGHLVQSAHNQGNRINFTIGSKQFGETFTMRTCKRDGMDLGGREAFIHLAQDGTGVFPDAAEVPGIGMFVYKGTGTVEDCAIYTDGTSVYADIIP